MQDKVIEAGIIISKNILQNVQKYSKRRIAKRSRFYKRKLMAELCYSICNYKFMLGAVFSANKSQEYPKTNCEQNILMRVTED